MKKSKLSKMGPRAAMSHISAFVEALWVNIKPYTLWAKKKKKDE